MFTVLAQHEALVSELKKGSALIKTADGERKTIEVDGGVAEVSNNQATILL